MNENEDINKNSSGRGHYLMLIVFLAITAFKWYAFITGYNYYKTYGSPTSVVTLALSVIVIALLFWFIKQTKDKWAKRYLIAFLLFILVGQSFSYISNTIVPINLMPLFDALFFSLFCINLAYFEYIYKQTGFTIFTKNITSHST